MNLHKIGKYWIILSIHTSVFFFQPSKRRGRKAKEADNDDVQQKGKAEEHGKDGQENRETTEDEMTKEEFEKKRQERYQKKKYVDHLNNVALYVFWVKLVSHCY